jgi:hypothetical protein
MRAVGQSESGFITCGNVESRDLGSIVRVNAVAIFIESEEMSLEFAGLFATRGALEHS